MCHSWTHIYGASLNAHPHYHSLVPLLLFTFLFSKACETQNYKQKTIWHPIWHAFFLFFSFLFILFLPFYFSLLHFYFFCGSQNYKHTRTAREHSWPCSSFFRSVFPYFFFSVSGFSYEIAAVEHPSIQFTHFFFLSLSFILLSSFLIYLTYVTFFFRFSSSYIHFSPYIYLSFLRSFFLSSFFISFFLVSAFLPKPTRF